MSAGRRRRGGGGDHHGADERWLLTYADMITLLMCLFMVLWSISSVNISKLQELQRSLQEAFIGKVMDSGTSVLSGEPTAVQGVQDNTPDQSSVAQPQQIVPAAISHPISQATQAAVNRAAQKEQESLLRVQQQVLAYARRHGFAKDISTTIDQRGLVIRVLTDKVLFDSGEATIKAAAYPLIDSFARLILQSKLTNPIRIEGNTDNVPISGTFHDNWELSAARATAVLERFLAQGIPPHRLSMAGYADQNPVAPNTTAAGRALNRRVDVVILRHNPPPQGATS
ncbi:MAG TPA: flagellar motor protein MotB [Gaiellales bacterium]|nr:flagellar motor protein MotB [Gaiellales bacterium]